MDDPGVRDGIERAKVQAHTHGTVFTPPDEIFSNEYGQVRESATPALFVHTVLCDRWEVISYIESGQFGRGWRAKDLQSGDEHRVFIKTLRSHGDRHVLPGGRVMSRDSHETAVEKEIKVFLNDSMLEAARHENIAINIPMFGHVRVPATGREGDMFFFLSPDLCEGGELFEYLCFQRREPPFVRNFHENHARRLYHQLVQGVKHLHGLGCYHRDLKLENIVLDSRYNLKIMDFGSAKFSRDCSVVEHADGTHSYVTRTITGTLAYQPPELIEKSKAYNPAAFDVWCTGVILFLLVAMESLFHRRINFNLFVDIIRKRAGYGDMLSRQRDEKGVPTNDKLWRFLSDVEDSISPACKTLFNQIFDLEPEKRITINQIAEHEFFSLPMPSHEEFEAEMSSRPTRAGKDRVYSIAGRFSTEAEAMRLIHAAVEKTVALAAGSAAAVPIVVHEHAVAVGEPPLVEARIEGSSLVLRWLTGRLEDWLTFVFGVTAELKLE